MGLKKPKSGHDKAIVDVWQREVGQLSTRNFALRLAASQDLVLRLDILRKLEKHRGCVNTVSFNASGEILLSGSDDRRVILWDWEIGHVKLSFHSGHDNNVFQAKFMPYSDDLSIVTCAADGQVRHAQILDGGRVETSLLGRHQSRAHKLAIEPGSPHIFYTCGEDGLVQHFDLRTKASMELFTCHSTQRHPQVVNLNAIAIDPRNPNLFAVGGSDEYTRVYDIRRYKWDGSTSFDKPVNYYCPEHLVGDENVGITGLAYSGQSELLVSYNDEHIYLFDKDMGLGPNPAQSSPVSTSSDADELECDDSSMASRSLIDTDSKPAPRVFKGHYNRDTVKGVGFFGPKCEYVVSGSDCGRMFIWRKKDGELLRAMEADKDVVNCIESHPHSVVLASSGIESDIKIWTPKAMERATLPANIDEGVMRKRSFFFSFGGSDEDDDSYSDDDDDDDNESGDLEDEMFIEGDVYSRLFIDDGILDGDDDDDDSEEDDDVDIDVDDDVDIDVDDNGTENNDDINDGDNDDDTNDDHF